MPLLLLQAKSEECLCSSGQQGRIQDAGGPQKSKRKRPNERKTTPTPSATPRWPPMLHPSSGYASASEWIRPFLLVRIFLTLHYCFILLFSKFKS